MAGYIFSVGKKDVKIIIEEAINNGVFSVNVKMNTRTPIPFEGTLADYITMKAGDNIYFFSERMIYGIGELVNVGTDCKYCNYPNSSFFKANLYSEIKNDLIIDYGANSENNRWICFFKPNGHFFKKGVDMDDALTYKPESFKALRAFWQLSFIKIDDEENKVLKEILLLRNINSDFYNFTDSVHKKIESKITKDYLINSNDLLKSVVGENNNEIIKHEMAIEVALLDNIQKEKNSFFGKWDYLSHQVIASPFKPISYMDKIDIFGYKYLEGTTVIEKFLIVEIKKSKADKETVEQISKYIDWVCSEYAYGNYSMIEAYIVAYDYSNDAVEFMDEIITRNYIYSKRPLVNKTWNNLKLLKYKYNEKELNLSEVK